MPNSTKPSKSSRIPLARCGRSFSFGGRSNRKDVETPLELNELHHCVSSSNLPNLMQTFRHKVIFYLFGIIKFYLYN